MILQHVLKHVQLKDVLFGMNVKKDKLVKKIEEKQALL